MEKLALSRSVHLQAYLPLCCHPPSLVKISSLFQIINQKKRIFNLSKEVIESVDMNFAKDGIDRKKIKNSLFVEPEKSLQMLLRDPYQDDFDARFIKEPIPYGNPFKLVVRSSGIGIEEEIHNEAEVLLHGKIKEGKRQVGKKAKKLLRWKQKEGDFFIYVLKRNHF